ncbi:hypothetical protein CY34DRAFT_224742 [Suillus luteus UH-Slu-Lm8-n1]|uniref:WD40 repeat-like protein n=1 Tax=Suillus luteus UH-Slu-Lm8-n1 TaxID=930992 RepID=A0A0D0AH66_9AGAM|nr:hypothetical protein CY34DRAFT_224742 [Suillus luteus UH-Slu-Lm8-n1]
MASPISKKKETSAITHRQKFEGHTEIVWGAIHLPGGQRIMTCSKDGSLRVWNSKSGKQIGDDWRDRDSEVRSMALSPDGKKVVSGSVDGAVRLWDIDTCKVIKKWTGHTKAVRSVCWSRDGRRVSSRAHDGTARQWDVESGEIILEPILTGHDQVWAAVYSPGMTLIATGGCGCIGPEPHEFLVKIWDAKTRELVATLKGHTDDVWCLAWTKDGKTLISGSNDHSIRIWNTTNWKQTAVLDDHTKPVIGIAISPNGRILASASGDKTVRLWNLDSGQPISSPIQHPDEVNCVSFLAGGKQLATGCDDKNAYVWDVAAILQEAGLDDLLSDPKPKMSALHVNATRPPIQSSARSFNPPDSTFLSRLFHRSPSTAHDTSSSSPLDWARNLSKWRVRSDEGTELQGHSPAVVDVPFTRGKPRNASARGVAFAKQKQKMQLHSMNATAGSSQSTKPNVTQPSSQPQAANSSSSTTPATGDTTAATTSTLPSRPHAMIRHPGVWTRFWLFIGCISPEYTDGDK